MSHQLMKELISVFQNAETDASIVSALVATIAAYMSWHFSSRQVRDTKFGQQLQLIDLRQHYFDGLQAWAGHIVFAMSEAHGLCVLDPTLMPEGDFYNRRQTLYWTLSALVDQGRWFFPNIQSKTDEAGKQGAFQGARQEVLNAILEQMDFLKQLNFKEKANNGDLAGPMVAAKRIFVSQIQQILSPNGRNKEFEELTAIVKPS